MKKNFLYAILAASLLLCGCEKEQLIDETETTKQTDIHTVQSTETTAAVTAEEPSKTTFEGLAESTEKTSDTNAAEEESTEDAEENAAPAEEYTEGEEYLLNILGYLQGDDVNDEYEEIFSYTGFSQYDFWDGFTLDGYSYVYRGDDIYDVTLICSDSICEMFPNGESEWYFKAYMDSVFCPAELEEKIAKRNEMHLNYKKYHLRDDTAKNAYLAAADFSLYTKAFEADGEWFENYTDISSHGFYHAHNPNFVLYDPEKDESLDVTPEEFAAAVKKLYNINMTAEQARSMTDETGFMRKDCSHGAGWLYDLPAGYEETEDEIKVTVDYYGDNLYFYPTIRSEYTFSKNEDGTITLQNVEKIFDRGYKPASDSI